MAIVNQGGQLNGMVSEGLTLAKTALVLDAVAGGPAAVLGGPGMGLFGDMIGLSLIGGLMREIDPPRPAQQAATVNNAPLWSPPAFMPHGA